MRSWVTTRPPHPRHPLVRVVSHAITIIYKSHSGSVAQSASPGPRPCTLQSIFARNPELLRVSMVVRASITWNIQGAWRLPWGPAQGFYSDLIIRHDFFMSYDSPVELESALNLCDSHGSQRGEGGGAGCPPPWLSLTHSDWLTRRTHFSGRKCSLKKCTRYASEPLLGFI